MNTRSRLRGSRHWQFAGEKTLNQQVEKPEQASTCCQGHAHQGEGEAIQAGGLRPPR
jgi:hypothetical protein